jgi:2,3,4,5-tetrahydropyridine-2-carboxylate N-succinyltransferase
VLEPVGAMPVIVEDDVLVGGNTGIYEGAVIKQRAVIAAGTVLTGSTPVYDLVNSRIIHAAAGQPPPRRPNRGAATKEVRSG